MCFVSLCAITLASNMRACSQIVGDAPSRPIDRNAVAVSFSCRSPPVALSDPSVQPLAARG